MRKSFKVLSPLICGLFLSYQSGIAQYRWDHRDPLDLDIIDLGDNKVALYNALGIGLSLLLDISKDDNLTPLPRQSASLQYWKEYQREPLSNIWKLAWRKRYPIRKYLYIGFEPHVSYVTDSDVSTFGTGCLATFEWHIVRTDHFHLIYDNGVGPNVFLDPYPFGGTRFNFTTMYGLRLEYKISETWYQTTIYNLHISNADIKGVERNPAMDAVGVSVGLSF